MTAPATKYALLDAAENYAADKDALLKVRSGKWFTIADCLKEHTPHAIPTMTGLDSHDLEILAMSLYGVFFLGQIPTTLSVDPGELLLISVASCMKDDAGLSVFEILTPITPSDSPARKKLAEASKNILTFLAEIKNDGTLSTRLTAASSDELSGLIADVLYRGNPAFVKAATEFGKMSKRHSQLAKVIDVFSFFFWLVIKDVNKVEDYWTSLERKRAVLLGHVGLPDDDIFQDPDTRLWSTVKRKLTGHSSAVGLHVANAYISGSTTYDYIKKFFALRMEGYGLALLNLVTEINRHIPAPKALRELATQANVNSLGMMYYSTIVYMSTSETAVTSARNAQALSKDITIGTNDQKAGKFCRLFSSEYLKWLNFFDDPALSKQIIGLAQAVGVDVGDDSTIIDKSDINYTFGFEIGRDMLGEVLKDDTIATDRHKAIRGKHVSSARALVANLGNLASSSNPVVNPTAVPPAFDFTKLKPR